MAITLIKYKQLDLVGKILNADIGISAAIATSKLADGSLFAKTNVTNTFSADQNLGAKKITNLASGTVANDAINKSQLDAVDTNLTTQINNINTALLNGLKTPLPFDASTNATFPSKLKGDTYKVTVAGTTSGVNLEVGDTIIYDANGSTPYVVQTNIDKASETVVGIIRIATSAEVTAGVVNDAAVVPAYLQAKLTAFQTALETTFNGRYVRYDASQTLNAGQKSQARTNIGAADDAEVVKITGNQTIGGTKTFSSPVVVPAGTLPDHAINKAQLDSTILTSGMDNLILAETPTGTLNGTNKIFSLANTPKTGKEIMVFLNGQGLYKTNDYTISGASITFVNAPETTDVIKVTYIK